MFVVLFLRVVRGYKEKQLFDNVVLFGHHEADTRILLERVTEALFRVKKSVGRDTRRPVKLRKDMLAYEVKWEIV